MEQTVRIVALVFLSVVVLLSRAFWPHHPLVELFAWVAAIYYLLGPRVGDWWEK